MSEKSESIYGSCESLSPENEKQIIKSNIKSTSLLIGQQAKHIDEKLSKIENDTIQSYKSNSTLASNNVSLTQTEALIDKWISTIKNRYQPMFEVDEDDVRSLVIQVIKTSFVVQSENPENLVDKKMNDFLNEIAKPEQRSKMMRRALNKFNEENCTLDALQKNSSKIIKQVDDLLTQLGQSEQVLSKEQKCQLYELFLSEELSELNSLVYKRIDNCVDEFTSPSKSKEKLLPKDTRFDIIKSIFDELNRAEERFGNTTHLSQLNAAVLATVIGLENFSPQYSDRHIRYEEILKHLLACFGGCNMNLEEMKKVISLRKTIFDQQWEKFANEHLKRNNLSQSDKTVIDILTSYFRNNNEVKIDLLELEYYISSLLEMGNIKNLYSIVKSLSSFSTSARPLYSLILNMADRREMIKVARKFHERNESQRKEYQKVVEAKNEIISEFSVSCGVLNQAEREKQVAVMKHFLDILDRLLAETNGEDISCSERIRVLNELKGKERSEKDSSIENRVADAINSRVLAITSDQPLPVDSIGENVEEILKKTKSADTKGAYKRGEKIGQVVMLFDVYDNFGRVKKEQAREVFFKNKTVLVNHGDGQVDEFYRLSNDFNLLTADSNQHTRSLRDYSNELSVEFKKYKLIQFKNAIVEFNKERTTKNFVQVSRGLVYYLTLGTDLKANQQGVLKFLEAYYKTVEKLVFINKEDQEIIGEMRVALDMYFQGQTSDKQSSDVSQSLRGVLRFKTYKDADFNLINEQQNEFKSELSKNSYFVNELNEILNEKLGEIIWLRGLREKLSSQPPHLFFKKLNKLIDKHIPADLKNVNKNSIEAIKRYLAEERGDTTEKWEEKLVESIISQSENKQDPHTLEKLSAFVHRNSERFSLEFLKKHVLESNFGDFSTNMCREYALKLLKEKQASFNDKFKEETSMAQDDMIWSQLKEAVVRAFEILDVDSSSTRKISFKEFLDYLNELFDVIPKEANDESFNSTRIHEKEIKFITARINNSDVQTENSPSANQTVYDKYPSLKEEERGVFLKLLLFMPDSFYTSQIKDAYKIYISNLIIGLIGNIQKYSSETQGLIRMHVVRFFLAFLEQEASDLKMEDEEQTSKKSWISEIRESLVRAFDKMPTSEFFKCSIKWLEHQPKTGKNFVLKICRETIVKGKDSRHRFDYVPMLLYDNEREHIKAILGYENPSSDDLSKELQTNCSQPASKINDKLSRIFNDSPIVMWSEEMIELRLRRVINLMPRLQIQDHGTSKLANILTAYRYFHEQHGPRSLAKSLNTLDLICSNIDKFTSVEELKQSIYSIVNAHKLPEVDELIKSGRKFTIGLDLIFRQIDVPVDDKKLKNDLEILKLALSAQPFAEISHFCQLLVTKMREKLNIDVLSHIVDLIIKSRAYNNPEMVAFLRDNDMSLWPASLKKQVLLNEFDAIPCLCKWGLKEKQKAVNVLHRIGEEKGMALQETLLTKLKELDVNEQISMKTIKTIILILNKILHSPFESSAPARLGVKLHEWEAILFDNKSGGLADGELSARQLVELMQTEDKTSSAGINESVKQTLEGSFSPLEQVLSDARNLDKKSVVHSGQKKPIKDWEENEIKEWAAEFKKSQRREEIYAWSKSSSEMVSEVLSVLIRAVMIYDHYPTGPRNTQLMSLLMFLENRGKGRLGNVYTGEGKTLITVLLATCLALTGKRVDVVTSSKVLAVRDSKARTRDSRDGYKGFYAIFGLVASNNCDEECEREHTGDSERAQRYESAQIVYGETSFFQRDILLTQFFKKKIRSDVASDGYALILDEVDSMMIDNAAKTLYLSHNITDMRHLRDIFLNIWAAVNSHEERHFTDENVEKVFKYINQIIDVKSQENSPISIAIPSTLREFVSRNLKKWIESAYTAKHVEEDNTYIIGDSESQRQNEPIIMDKDTGVEQTSSKWGDGLHQFIQLKHSGRLSDESLKAVYMSNAGFFQSYDKLYGMTGTVGGPDERKLLAQVYGIDFFEMPRFKRYRFEYDFESESVAGTVDEWLDNIVNNIDENMDQELTYTQENIDSMRKKLQVEREFSKRLTDSQNNTEANLTRLCEQRDEFEKEKLMFSNIFEIIEDVRVVCERADLQTFGSKINAIINRVNSLESSEVETCKSFLSKFKSLFGTTARQADTENKIGDFDAEFKQEKDKLKIVDSNTRCVQELEMLDARIKQAEEEVVYVKEAIQKSQSDIAVYEKECSCQVGSVRADSRRAVLVICDSIADLKLIEERLRTEFTDPKKYRLFKYDRAYKKFDVSCLEAGDVVIATNIAGRGTDLIVSKLVEENGGLHVIMSYMPKNLRIEKQGFGRTARAGNRGTGTFIVLDPRHLGDNTIDVVKLKNERDDEETRRLGVVQRQHLPKIKLEDELFVEFNNLQQTIEPQLESKYASLNHAGFFSSLLQVGSVHKTSSDFVQLQLASLKNHWAIWLNQVSDKLAKVHESGKDPVYSEFFVFKNAINEKLASSRYGLIEEPGELNKLGRLYLDSEKYSEAIDVFNFVIDNHADFASIAYYYKAFAVIQLDQGGFEAKRKLKPTLKHSLRLLEDERSRVLSRNQILKSINQMARSHGKSLDSDLFSRQNEDEARLLSVHINAINSAIGSQVSSDCFNAAGIVGDQPERVYDELLKSGCNVIKGFRLSTKCKIINTSTSTGHREIYLNDKVIRFPDTFEYCREQVLEKLAQLLDESRSSVWSPHKRQLAVDSFSEFIYTKEKFEEDTRELVEKKRMVRISPQVDKKLLGSQVDPVYCGQGDEVKRVLMSKFVLINKKAVEKKLNEAKCESTFFGKKSEILEMFEDNRIYLQEEMLKGIESIAGPARSKDGYEAKLNSLLQQLGLNEDFVNQFAQEDLVRILMDRTKLSRVQVDAIIGHLENYEKISIDHKFLEQRVREAKNESIFFGKKSEIREFCLGNRQITIADRVVELKDNETYDREHVVRALRTLTKQSENVSVSAEEKSRFNALLIQLGFETGLKLEAITSFNNYSLKDPDSMVKIKKYLEVINLKDSVNSYDTINTIDRLDLAVAPPLDKKSAEILAILKANLGVDKELRKEDFNIKNDKEFIILRAILTDAKLIKSSLFNVLTDGEKNGRQVNQELETILMHFFYEDGSISDKSIILKEARQGSEELFARLLELRVIKHPKVKFEFAEGKYVPEFVGGNAWKNANDPARQIEYIREKVEKVVYEVFKLERRSDTLHTFNEYVTSGIGTESKNKDLDEKIETITNIIKSLAGTLKTMPDVKVKHKDLRSMFVDGNVPSELKQYIHMCFDKVLEYEESKGFDWDCLMCAMIGVAQIVAGVALEVLSGGSAHLIAQTLIAEGIGDIIFAIQSAVEGNFSWKTYAQHKVQSLMISLLTMGVGALLSRGAQASKLAVGLATRTAINKAILKTVILEGASAVMSAAVNVGSEEISKLIIEELASVHFVQYFEKWQAEDSGNQQKLQSLEEKLIGIYEKFGESVAKPNIDKCIDASLQDLSTGQIGNKVYAQAGKVVGGVLKGMSQAANKFKKGSSKAKVIGTIVSVLSKTVQVAEYAKNFSQLCMVYNEYYDLVINRIERLEETLAEQKRNGTLKIDDDELAREKTRISYSGKVKNDVKKLKEKAQVAFKLKVKNGLLQPAVSSLLYTAVSPIKSALLAPLADAMNELAEHIEERAEMFMEEIKAQTSDNVAKLTSSQKRALELRGDIIPVDDISSDSVLMKAELANFPNDTIESLRNEHGSNLSIMVQDGQVFAVLPTYSQFCSSFECGEVNLAGQLHASMHATFSERNIELVNINDANEFVDDAERKTITPLDGSSEKEKFKIGFAKGKDGKVGHFAPVIVDQHGQQQVINLDQTKQTEGSCLTQSVIFLEAYEQELAKNGGKVDEAVRVARTEAENAENVAKRNKMIGKAMRSNSELKNSYYQGTTVKSDRIVGGLKIEDERIEVEKEDLPEFNRLVEKGKRDNVFDDFFKEHVDVDQESLPGIDIDKEKSAHHIASDKTIIDLLSELKNLNLDQETYINVLKDFINSPCVKDIVMDIINKKETIYKRSSASDGRLIFSAFCWNPHNLIYGPGNRSFLNNKNKLTSKKLRGYDLQKQPIDNELFVTQEDNANFQDIITKITAKDSNLSVIEKLKLFGSLPKPARVYWQQFLANINKADKIDKSITLAPEKYYVRQIIKRNL